MPTFLISIVHGPFFAIYYLCQRSPQELSDHFMIPSVTERLGLEET